MEYLLTGAEMSACDQRTSDPAVIGIPSLVLMERAALSVADGVDAFLQAHFLCGNRPRSWSAGCDDRGAQTGMSFCPGPAGEDENEGETCRRPLVLAVAGRGNNGADALAAGRILLDRGYHVRFCRLSGEIPPGSSFAVQERILQNYGADVEIFDADRAPAAGAFMAGQRSPAVPDVIIDGLFGTGLSRALEGEAAACMGTINRCRSHYGSYVVAVDIPSGISSDSGEVMGCAVHCDETRTFAFYKRGHFLYPGAAFSGILHLSQIGITERALADRPGMFTFLQERPADLVPSRDPGGNKGTFGKVLIVAGRKNMGGAALLAARACMASGAGMVKVFTHEANRVIMQQSLPEALLDTFSEDELPEMTAQKLRSSLDWADIAAAGPAMGTDRTAQLLLRTVLEYAGSAGSRLRGMVLDADALRILASQKELCTLLADRPPALPCILTPHLAEFAALAGCSVRECRKDRGVLVQAQADRLQCTIVCKDARTLAAYPCRGEQNKNSGSKEGSCLFLNCRGNSGMATAGSGDVLTGISAALLGIFSGASDFADGIYPSGSEGTGFAAACSAVCLHAIAGDAAAARLGEAGMTAGDLIAALRERDFFGKKQRRSRK